MENGELFIYRLDYWGQNHSKYHIFKNVNVSPEKPHTHEFIEIVYVVSGSAEEKVNDECYTVKRGDVIFINYGSRHEFSPNGEFCYINICFHPETVVESLITGENAFALLQLTAFDEIRRESEGGMVSFSGAERDGIEKLLLAMEAEYKGDNSFKSAMLDSYMNILLVKILRNSLSVSDESVKSGDFSQLLDYIDNNLGTKLTLEDLARKCFYNPSYFSRIFKERFGMSLSDYLSKRRIETAIRLLKEGRLTVGEIAEQTGYPTKSSFYRAFSKVTGTTPSEYR